MAYNITSTSGLTSYTITNGVINNQTNLSFIGKGSLNYGSSLNTNFLKLLENFADVAEPDSPIIGQIWWDTSTNNLRVYDGVEFGIVTPPLDRIASSTIGNLEIASSSITGEITNGNINIGPNGTGNTVINRLAILNTGVGKVPYTAANGMIVTSTLSFNPTDNTLTATNLSATNIAGTLTTGPQAAITSVGTLNNLAVAGNITTTGGNIGIGTTTPLGNIQIQSALESPTIRLTNTSSLFSTSPDFNNEGPPGIGFSGTSASTLVFERTSNFSRSTNLVGGIYWKNTLTNNYVISSSITATSSNSGSGNFRLLYRAHHQHRFDTSSVNPNGSYDFTTAAPQLSITPVGSAFLGNLTIGNGYALAAPPTNYSALHVYGNIIGYFNGPIGTNASANTGAFTTLTTTGNVGIGTTTPSGNIQIQSANESPIIRLTNTSSAFTTTPDFNNEIPLGLGYGPGFGIGGSLLVFERTSTFSRNSNPIGGIYWKNTLTNSYVISGSITAISSNQSSGSMRLFYKAGGQHRFETYPVNADGSYNISGSTTQFSITPSGSNFLGNLSVGTALGPPTNGVTLAVAGNITGYFEGAIGANTANTGAFTTVTTTGNINANGSVIANTPFFENSTTVTVDYTISAGKNAGTFGPVTINSGVTVTIPSGSVWSVV